MSDADLDESVTSTDGVTVRRRVNRDHERHLAVVFTIESGREDVVELEIVDAIDPDHPVGFHPDHGGRYWKIDDDTVTFRKALEPGERYTTVYAVGYAKGKGIQSLQSEPSIALRHGSPAKGEESSQDGDPRSSDGGPEDSRRAEPEVGEDLRPDSEHAFDELFDFADEEAGVSTTESGIDSDETELLDVSSEDVSVAWGLVPDQSRGVVVIYDVTSTLDRSAVIRVEQSLPAGMAIGDVTFSEKHGGVHWRTTAAGPVFQRLFAPGESVRTMVVFDTETEAVVAQLEEPVVTVEGEFSRPSSGRQSSRADSRAVSWDLESILVSRDDSASTTGTTDQAAGGRASTVTTDEEEIDEPRLGAGGPPPGAAGTADDVIEELLGSSRPDSAIEPLEGLLEETESVISETDGGNPVGTNPPEDALDHLLGDSWWEGGLDDSDTLSDEEATTGFRDPSIDDRSAMPDGARTRGSEAPTREARIGQKLADRLGAIEARLEGLESTISERPTPRPEDRERIQNAFNRSIAEAVSPELDELRAVIHELETAVESNASNTTSILEELRLLEESTASIEHQLANSDDTRAELSDLIEAINRGDADIRDSVDDRTTEIAELREAIENRLSELQDELEELPNPAAVEEDRLGRIEDRFQSQLADHTAELNEIKSTLAATMESLYQLRNDEDQLWSELERIADSADSTRKELSNLSDAVESLEAAVSEATAATTTSQDELESYESEMERVSSAITELTASLVGTDDRIDGLAEASTDHATSIGLLTSMYLSRLNILDAAHLADLSEPERKLLGSYDQVPVSILSGIGPARSRALESNLDVTTIEDLADVDPSELIAATDVTEEQAERFIDTASAISRL